jgi:hypothetical protein
MPHCPTWRPELGQLIGYACMLSDCDSAVQFVKHLCQLKLAARWVGARGTQAKQTSNCADRMRQTRARAVGLPAWDRESGTRMGAWD